jgi:hypothetical protein
MKRLFAMLLLLDGVAVQAAPAGEQAADSSATATAPAAAAQDAPAGNESSGPAQENGKATGDKEPDCE